MATNMDKLRPPLVAAVPKHPRPMAAGDELVPLRDIEADSALAYAQALIGPHGATCTKCGGTGQLPLTRQGVISLIRYGEVRANAGMTWERFGAFWPKLGIARIQLLAKLIGRSLADTVAGLEALAELITEETDQQGGG